MSKQSGRRRRLYMPPDKPGLDLLSFVGMALLAVGFVCIAWTIFRDDGPLGVGLLLGSIGMWLLLDD